jgi:DNA polymerase-1
MKFLFLDFEFTGVAEPDLKLVSCAWGLGEGGKIVEKGTAWLHGQGDQIYENKQALITKIYGCLERGYTLVSYVLEAEMRAILTLEPYLEHGSDYKFLKEGPLKLSAFHRALDIYLEYRNILNSNHFLSYGEQYIGGKVIKTTPPPNKWEVVDGDDEDTQHHKPEYSLAAACFKLIGVKIDTEEKDRIRGIIIRGDAEEIERHKKEILKYNESDIVYLYDLLKTISRHYELCGKRRTWFKDALNRGNFSIDTAHMVRCGYPVNVSELRKFAAASKEIMSEVAKAVNDSGVWTFRADGSMDQKAVKTWVEKFVAEKGIKTWRRTPKGELSISKDAFGDFKKAVEETPFGAAFREYLSTKQSLNGFLPPREGSKRKKTFWDFLGSDGRVRPHFGIFGSQTSRSQPASTGFMFLKAKWMRYFVEPPPGSFLIEVDYSSQEFLIAAIISQDKKMMNAYESGDVYLAFAKDAGLVPKNGERKDYEDQRKLCKGIVLGVSYDMSAKGLAPRIGKTEKEAQSLINKFYEAYPDYAAWKKKTIEEYRTAGHLELSDGWMLGPHNDNMRSVGNFPIQGHGAVIMRHAVRSLFRAKIHVAFTVHDSIVCEINQRRPEKCVEDIKFLMNLAFTQVMSAFGETRKVRMDAKVWGGGKRYVAEGAEKQLARYKKYFS